MISTWFAKVISGRRCGRRVMVPNVPAQVIPVTYLRWDLVSGGAEDEWGSEEHRRPSCPHHLHECRRFRRRRGRYGRSSERRYDSSLCECERHSSRWRRNAIDEESSFDKIYHVLLPKQVTPYRIDFPNISLKNVKNVRMEVKATLVPASADPVIGVMNQKIDSDVQGKSVLHGDLLNQSGQTVNIPT